MSARRPDWRTRMLAASGLLLAGVVALEVLFPYQGRTATPGGGPEAAAAAMAATSRYVHPQFGSYPDILERPLVFPERRMPAGPVAAPAAPRTPLRVRLEGVAAAGGDRVALLRDLGNNQIVQLSAGMTHAGWTLDEITSTSARFSRGEESTEISLEVER